MRTYSRRKPPPLQIPNVHELCRLCLGRLPDMMPIFDSDGDNVFAALPMKIMMCVGLEVKRDDKLPKLICQQCNLELDKFYIFKKNCAKAYRKLKASLVFVKDAVKFDALPQNTALSLDNELLHNTEHNEVKIQSGNIIIGFENGDNTIQKKINISHNSQHIKSDNSKTLVREEIEYNILNKFNNQNIQEQPNSSDQIIASVEELSTTTDLINDISAGNVEVSINDVDEEEQVQTIEPQMETNTPQHLTEFIVTSLIEEGVLAKRGDTLEILNQDMRTFQLETANGSQIVMELVVEESEETSKPRIFAAQSATKNGKDSKYNAWRCGECGARWSSRAALARHERVHSGERPFACACGRRFAQRAVLRRHELLHRDVRPFACAECPKAYTQRSALEAHARSHAPLAARLARRHRCARCPKTFLYPSGLSRHMQEHAGRLFACERCARAFRDKSSLRRHRRRHKDT